MTLKMASKSEPAEARTVVPRRERNQKNRYRSWSRLMAGAMALAVSIVSAGQCQSSKPAASTHVPSLFDPVNRQLPKWMRFSGEFRDRAEGRTSFNFVPDSGDGYDLTRFRLNLELTPKKWLRFFVQGQDAQAAGIDPAHLNSGLKDNFDLRQGYAEVDAGLQNRMRLRVGRQELIFGAQRLVGALDWGNTSRSFDAARLTLAWSRARVDVFAASVVNIRMTSPDKRQPGVNLYGIYGSLSDRSRRTTLQPYIFWKTNPRVISEEGQPGDEDLVTLGFRWTGRWPHHFDSAMEMAREAGSFSNDSIGAWAGYWIGGYTLAGIRFQPRLSMEYDYASGDGRPNDGEVGTFDQLYPTNHAYYGITDQVGWRNMRALRTGTDLSPNPKLKVHFDYYWFWLASRYDGLYNAGGALVVKAPPGGARHTDIGQETDAFLSYAFAPQLTFGGGFGHLFPGRFLKDNLPGSGTSFPYVFATYHF
jgi:hypothetical protein